ncbi:MAG: DNA-directed RNA polymerase [Parcubacteria group bacterium GW2011_GWE2_37_8]|nr:MAG: DNA-directed RNA polymerase [Parcubacteria group bacterium GW2011_GWE2_37_8]
MVSKKCSLQDGRGFDLPLGQLEKVVYFAAYIITNVNDGAKKQVLSELAKEFKSKYEAEENKDNKEKIKEARDRALEEINSLKKYHILSEVGYHNLSMKYSEVFEASTGSEAIKKLFSEIDTQALYKELLAQAEKAQGMSKKNVLKRLKLIHGIMKSKVRPEWMFIEVLPVLPPDLRPMVPLDGGRYASSDLNDLYRRVINRNNRLKKLLELNAPEVICRNEKRMLQEAVDALIDNSARRGQGVMASTGQKRKLKSLADMLKGKQGRFRQNLLGKRVDYSGRSVIVVGPDLHLDQCGLPKKMALELFKPFVINKIIEGGLAHNIRGANRLIAEGPEEIWAFLEEVIQDKTVLLNRAPTLHRLGVQAFRPILIEGSAIRLHPLTCRAFNADFDGDQMAVHVPLTIEAQHEAKTIMLSANNLLKPATGEPITDPDKDIVLGCFWMTVIKKGAIGEGKIFGSKNEAVLAYQNGIIEINAEIKVLKHLEDRKNQKGEDRYIKTSVGRIIFNTAIPNDFGFINKEMNKKSLKALMADLIETHDFAKMKDVLDRVKSLGYEYATKSGLSWGYADLVVPKEKEEIIKTANKEVETIYDQYQNGFLTDEERYDRVIEIWHKAKNDIAHKVREIMEKENNSVYTIISSGARGSWAQPVQLAGMRGLMASPSGRTIELPVISNFKEGLTVLEYFISTHGARKGSADTALRTASAGYLTRRLVDVSQDVVIREEDCKSKEGITAYRADAKEINQAFAVKLFGRHTLNDIKDGKSILVKAGEIITKADSLKIDNSGVDEVQLRSPITCQSLTGICKKCYGFDLGYNKEVKSGSAVGIVAAQAIGEPGTQLTMRTFHTGGVAGGGDITQGLPRVQELFEARTPKGKAAISEVAGKVIDIEEKEKVKLIRIETTDTKKAEIVEYKVPPMMALWVKKGELVAPGQQLCEGHLDLLELFKTAGFSALVRYIIREIQKVYVSEGEAINDKHVEIIIRQMLSRIKVTESGSTEFSIGDVVERGIFEATNLEMKKHGKEQAKGGTLLLGITKVALTTDSFLSAASFQETAKVLINAALFGKEDKLRGLKENVIIGKLIPAGTGFLESQSKIDLT